MKKYLLILLLVGMVGCGGKDDGMTPGEHLEAAFKRDTVLLSREILIKHDTLVIMITRDSVRYPKMDDADFWALPGGWEYGAINLFSDGKTIDTIRRHEIIYYKNK